MAPALIGITRGDDSAPGIGSRGLNKIPVEQRTTPAGRFIAKFGPAKGHPPVLWVDYTDAISLHPVVTANKRENRLQRIKSASAEDHRISFGCINVPASFYAKVVKPLFKARNSSGVVYILPDTKSVAEVFPGTVLQAQATLASATAKLAQDKAGATAQTLAAAQNSVAAAQVNVNNAQTSLTDTKAINAQSVAVAQSAATAAQTAVEADEATSPPSPSLAPDQAALSAANNALAAAKAKAQQSNDQSAASLASAQQQLASAKSSLAAQ